jgi:tetratricopeptide (TPR) repeat protein
VNKNASLQLSLLVVAAIACVVALVVMGYMLVRTEKPEVLVVGARLSKTLLPGAKGAELSFRLAMRLVDSKQYAEAKKVFEDILVAEPQNVSVLNNLAFLLGELGNYGSAAEYLQTALQINPSCAECLNNLGTIHQRQGRTKEAADSFERAASLDPNHPDPRLNLAVLYEEQGDWAAALDWYKQAEPRVQDPKQRKWVTLRALWMTELQQNSQVRKVAGEK